VPPAEAEHLPGARVLTYANLLTTLRVLVVPVFVALVVRGRPGAALMLFVAAGVSDGLDGLLARRLHQKTTLGSVLDPAADKLLVTAALVTLTLRSLPLAVHIPVALTATSILRDLLISAVVLLLYARGKKRSFPPSLLGKSTTAALLITIGFALLGNVLGGKVAFFDTMVYLTWMLTVASGLHYLFRTASWVRSYGRELDHGPQGHQDPQRSGTLSG
jgi:cardiolipin synthase